MEFPEEPRSARDPRIPDAHRPPRSGAEYEVEIWLRRELAFLYGVERRIKRRTRLRREAWRAAAVALILAMFAACWYIAALSTESAAGTGTGNACASKAASTAAGSTHTKTVTSANSAGTADSACKS
jgi:hypothetical protein